MECTGRTCISLVGFCWIYASLTKGDNCAADKYGPMCQYDCHCNSTVACDPQSGCNGQCADGWDGSTCQRQNVALHGNASQSGDYCLAGICYYANRAVDGEWGNQYFFQSNCAHTENDQNYLSEWRVSLNRSYNIYRFIIYNRAAADCCADRLNGFVVSVGSSSGAGSPGYSECYRDPTPSGQGPGDVLNKTCTNGPIKGDLVRIRQPRRNVGLTLCEVLLYVCSPGWYGEMCDRECNSTDACLRCSSNQLHCEECNRGMWGEFCDEPCGKCWDGHHCNKMTGVCPKTVDDEYRCAAGYKGDKCDQECDDGKYGADCGDNCGRCAGGMSQCQKDSGICPNISPRCVAGFKGADCKENCRSDEYGEDCKDLCGHCTQTCAVDSGICSGSPPCLAGYKGDLCKTECSDGTYGNGCSEACGACKGGNSTCDHTDGRCQSCDAGWHGSLCKKANHQEDDAAPGSSAQLHERNGAEYYNVVTFDTKPTAVTADELESYIRTQKASGGLKVQFENLPSGLQANHEVAKKPENKSKSRYLNIVAYDHSRVVLELLDDDPHSDYINACYIHGYKEENKYVASQGPTPFIINDFWRMIWQVNTGKLVMLTNLMENATKKCDRYWPEATSETMDFGHIRVTLFEEDDFAAFTVRTLHVINEAEPGRTRVINQFHFTTWPDHGVPSHATGLLDFRDKVHSTRTTLPGPLVVHCSAGIGRTGTFIGLDYLLQQARDDGVVDVPVCVRLMRQQKVNMIQTQEQYEFLYEALSEALKLADYSVPSANFPSVYRDLLVVDPATGEHKLRKQFEVLMDMSSTLTEADLKTALSPENKSKNRDLRILASDGARPFLSTPVKGTNNYINAVFLPAYKMKRAFILTQMPLPATVVDFWRLVYEQDVCSIIMLNSVGQTAKDVGIYWSETTAQHGPFEIQTLGTDNSDVCTTRTLQQGA